MGIFGQMKHAWNAFLDRDDNTYRVAPGDLGAAYGIRPDRLRLRIGNERSIISSIYTRISIDVASVDIKHVRLDEENRFSEEINSGINNCLNVEANLDQSGRFFRQDAVMSLLEEGTIALVPIDTSVDPAGAGSVDIQTMRVGRIVQWYPRHVRVDLYNDQTGRREEVTLEKRLVAIVENPLYSVMNEPNSTLQRLIRKLNMLDTADEAASGGKLDMIIQLPYVIKSEQRRQQAEQRRTDIEFQLKSSKYGIAYTDGTEKITQLNRSVENNLLTQIEYLMEMLYGQLGLTAEVINGTADEKTMLNYNNRTIEPILAAFADEFKRKFLTKTARTQRQSFEYYRDPFKLVPMSDLAEMADKFTRNEIVTSNEFRQFIGMKPSTDPKADELRNSNMPHADDMVTEAPAAEPVVEDEPVEDEVDPYAGLNETLDEVFKDLGVEG